MHHSFINDPNHYERRAAEARALAKQITDERIKERMLRIAKDYQKLAQGERMTGRARHVGRMGPDPRRIVLSPVERT